MKIKVGLDISQIAHQGGVVTYTDSLAHKLLRVDDIEMVYFYTSLRKSYKGDLPNVKSWFIPPTIIEKLFNDLRFPKMERLIGKVDIFHSSDWLQPPTKAKKVTTYHDLIPIKYPQWSHPKVVEVHKKRLATVQIEIDHIIAVSEATKRDLIENSNIPDAKITVIYEAAADYFKPQEKKDVEKFRLKMKLPEKFVLAISGVGERRNLDRAKEAVGNYPLIVMGKSLPYLPSEELPLLYSAAEVLLYPSLYEGFGLPILEAMACGVPVVTSNVSSMPEIGGSAAIYVNPYDVNDIKEKLTLVMEDRKLQNELQEKGIQRAKKFSWQKCTQETIQVYKDLMKD